MARPAKKDHIKALVINPFTRVIHEETIENSLQDMYRVTKCDCITAVYLNDYDCMYLDDEGLLVEPSKQAFFTFKGAEQPFAGCAVVVGTDAEGNSDDVRMTIFELGEKVRFIGTPRIIEEHDGHEKVVWGFV